ncbi:MULTISPECIES: two-component system sensor histidine kinase NtrB [unclassified Tepidimonas]|uniref:two-component system sensor histidine kinase NtrB n=1 Tax=unclassified Tepidimonas TaxID=2631705 RepID=UPI003C7A0D53
MNTADSPKADAAGASGFAPSWYAPAGAETAPHGLDPDTARASAETDDAVSPRLWRLLMGARLLVALALLAMLATAWWNGNAPGWMVGLCGALVAVSALAIAWPGLGRRRGGPGAARWLLTVWADLGTFALLQAYAPGNINFTPLFVWPVLLAAVAGPRLLALGSAAAGTLALLAIAWARSPGSADTQAWLQAAVTGSGLFIVALLANHLSTRLAREQSAARRSRQLATLHNRVNQLIATGLDEGIVVLDERGAVWYANPAAARMLGADTTHPLRHTPAWPLLAGWARGSLRAQALARPPAADGGAGTEQDLVLPLPDGSQRRVRVRLRTAQVADLPAAAVLFLADVHELEQRVHTEKLAAMGRVSAAVAHEIRNPLAAIAQASALLAEDDATPAQRHLIGLIEQNVRRLGRTVDDILEVARPPSPDEPRAAPALPLDEAVDAVLADWLRQHPQGPRLLRHAAGADARIAFDPEHLRRVLVNLLDNADRHAPPTPGTIRVETKGGTDHASITVWSEGPELPPHVRAHLFEPFTTSRSRSSGLGLYLSRQLCQRYHANLSYERSARDGREGHAFCVRMARR